MAADGDELHQLGKKTRTPTRDPKLILRKKRVPVSLPTVTWQRVDAFMKENDVVAQSAAIRTLVKAGLRALGF